MSAGTMPSLGVRLDNATARVGHILHLETMVVDAIGGDLWELLTEDAATVLAEALGVENLDVVLNRYADEDERPHRFEQEDALLDAIRYKPLKGWLVAGQIPVKKASSVGAFSYSWGYYETRWFYADTYDDAIEQVIAWADADTMAARGAGEHASEANLGEGAEDE